ncbi:MAG: hypothetical protein ACOX9R_18325 [Armatimonadota bacterium]|jgi:hypothetical protein
MRRWFFIGIAIAGVVSVLIALAGRPDLGSILILGATAWIVAHYTAETQKLREATRDMADASLAMAKQQCRAHLVLATRVRKPPTVSNSSFQRAVVFNGHIIELVNEGNGAALDVVLSSESFEQEIKFARIEGHGRRQMPRTSKDIRIKYRDHFGDYEETWQHVQGRWHPTRAQPPASE